MTAVQQQPPAAPFGSVPRCGADAVGIGTSKHDHDVRSWHEHDVAPAKNGWRVELGLRSGVHRVKLCDAGLKCKTRILLTFLEVEEF